MARIEEIGIENIIKAMNAHYKKFGRDKKFEQMEQLIIKHGKIQDWYEICKDVIGIDIDYFSRILATEYNKHEFGTEEFDYIQDFIELKNVNHSYFVHSAELSIDSRKLAWAVNNIKGIDVDYIVENAIKKQFSRTLFNLAEALPERRQELANAFLNMDIKRFENNYFNYVDIFPAFATLDGLNPKDFEDRFYYIVDKDSSFAEHSKFIEHLTYIKKIDYEKLASWVLRRKPSEIIKVLNCLAYSTIPMHESDKKYYEKQLLNRLFSLRLAENDYRELKCCHEHFDYLFKKAISSPSKESCVIAINLIEIYQGFFNKDDKNKIKDLIIQNTTNPHSVYKLSKFMPEAQEECEDAIIRLMRENQARPEDLMHCYIEISKQSENQDKMLDALIEMVNHLERKPSSLYVYYSNIENANVNKITECVAKHESFENLYSWLSNFRGQQQKQLAKIAYQNGNDLWAEEEIMEFKHDFNIKTLVKDVEEPSPLDTLLEELNK